VQRDQEARHHVVGRHGGDQVDPALAIEAPLHAMIQFRRACLTPVATCYLTSMILMTLLAKLPFSTSEVYSALLSLETAEHIRQLPGKKYIRRL